MTNAVDRRRSHDRAPGASRRAPVLRASLLAMGFVALAAFASAHPADAWAQGSKRLAATTTTGLPWDGCSDVESFVAEESGRYSVLSARCNGSIQAWLLERAAGAAASAERPQVVDQLAVRELQRGETFSAGPYCTVHGREVRWLAIYDWKQRKRITGHSGAIVEAWTANLRTGRIEPAARSLVREAVCTANPDE